MKNPTKTTDDRYTDDTKMPFGAHRGKKLKDIPERYMNWAYGVFVTDMKLMIYIHRNVERYEKESGIKWKRHASLDKELIEDYKLPDAVIELFS